MTNKIYGSWLQTLLDTYFMVEDHWTSSPMDIMVCGVSNDYVFDSNDRTVEDLGPTVVMAPRTMINVTTTHGLLKADVIETMMTEEEYLLECQAFVLFCANDDGSHLIAYIDEGQPTQMPFTILDGKMFIRWNPAGILRI